MNINARLTLLIPAALTVMLTAVLSGCASTRHDPYAPLVEARRDTTLAERLTREGVAKMPMNHESAERLFREALAADLYYGPAHNNLGVLYLSLDPPRLYEAAGEFEWARKLMPGHPDPRLNLALTLERAGRFDDAVAGYQSALEVDPNHLPTMQALARLQVRCGKADERTVSLLREIALRTESPDWREWAMSQAARMATSGK